MPTTDPDKVLVADIAIHPRSGGADRVFTYLVPNRVEIGAAFFVPMGVRSELGFVTDCYEADAETLGFPISQLRPVNSPVEGLSLPRTIVDLAKFVAEDTLCPLPIALAAATPPGARDRLVIAWRLTQEAPEKRKRGELRLEADDDSALTPLQQEVVRTMRDQGGILHDRKGARIEAPWIRALKLLQTKGIVAQETILQPFSERQSAGLLRLTHDSEKVERFLKQEAKKKPAQALVLMQLQEAGDTSAALSAAEIKVMAGVTDATVKALTSAGLLEPIEGGAHTAVAPPHPNPFQKLAIDAIVDAIQSHDHRPFLLFGVTGSGKTEVYLHAAAEALRQGQQVLYLVPEIALATQAIAKLRERFGVGVAVLHSELTPRERLQTFAKIRDGSIPIVLGARSALFAPLTNLGLIVVDEEHEAGYKQDTAPRYHSKRLALFLGREHRCPVVLGSATPSIESFYEAETDRLTLLTLPQRAASATLPNVIVEDLTEGYRYGHPSIFTDRMAAEVGAALEHGNQAIVFLNRRSYAPFVLCRDCGHRMTCPRCAVSLSFHRREGQLLCHHCGFKMSPPERCPDCQSLRITPLGIGTEKVEEALHEAFPSAVVGRLDRDVARKKGALEEVLALFRSGEIHILVGTQMVAKGLDFPNVTMVGVVAADVTLNLPDFRAGERTYQLLSQVAGRAGRGHKPGIVVIQTFNPDNIAVTTAQSHNYLSFYEHLKAERLAANYPPFRRLVNIVLSGGSLPAVVAAADMVGNRLRLIPDIEVLGPVDCVLERLKDRWRQHVLVKLPDGSSPERVGDALLAFAPKGVQVTVDVDPYSMM
jgi:primosomal protein N' (replication factor Y)